MKTLEVVFLCAVIAILLFGCESSTSSKISTISGKVVYTESTNPVNKAEIYVYTNEKAYGFGSFYYSHKISTNSIGEYSFSYSTDFHYRVLSEQYEDSLVTFCSPFLDIYTTDDALPLITDDLQLYENQAQSTLTLNFESSIEGVDTDSVNVHLGKRIGVNYVIIDSFITDNNLSYSFNNMGTGQYSVSIEKRTYDPNYESISIIGNHYYLPFVDGINPLESIIRIKYMSVEKPAIYIYPEKSENYHVSLKFLNETHLTKSIPEYNEGWKVFIDKTGKIDNKYDYLFYECALIKNLEFSQGYCYSVKDLRAGIVFILDEIGLNKQEIKDFIEYWEDRFQEYPFYKIYPLINSEIDNFVELQVSPQPDSVLRVWLYFEGCESKEQLSTPTFKKFERRKSVVVEWGGVMMN